MMLLQLGVDFLHRLQTNADDDEERRATEGQFMSPDSFSGMIASDGKSERCNHPGRGASDDPINHGRSTGHGATRTIPVGIKPVLLHVVRDRPG